MDYYGTSHCAGPNMPLIGCCLANRTIEQNKPLFLTENLIIAMVNLMRSCNDFLLRVHIAKANWRNIHVPDIYLVTKSRLD